MDYIWIPKPGTMGERGLVCHVDANQSRENEGVKRTVYPLEYIDLMGKIFSRHLTRNMRNLNLKAHLCYTATFIRYFSITLARGQS